jgi:hypothetical protein
VLRKLVHRDGLRADILEDREIRVGDHVQATTIGTPALYEGGWVVNAVG